MHVLHAIPPRLYSNPNSRISIFFILVPIIVLLPLHLTANPTYPVKPPHYRGLATTSDNTIWVSGTRGTVLKGRFTDSSTVLFDTLNTHFPNKDFRDIWAIDQLNAVAMSISDSAVIIKTTDGGKSWETVYHNETPGIFLDVIEIDPQTGIGIVLGDPLSDKQQEIHQNSTSTHEPISNKHKYNNPTSNGRTSQETNSNKHFIALLTTDFGSHWIEIPPSNWSIPVDTLESFFAASGTSLSIILSKSNHKKQHFSLTVGFAGGGLNPQFHLLQIDYKPKKTNKPSDKNPNYSSWQFQPLPSLPMHLKGGPAWGCYGLSIYQYQKGIAVGGNYALPNFRGDSTGAIAAYTDNLLNKWLPAVTPPNGYRSGVCTAPPQNKQTLFTQFFRDSRNHCQNFSTAVGQLPSDYFFQTHHQKNMILSFCTGTNGTDISFDGGKHWFILSQERGFNACTWKNNCLILVGNHGKIRTIHLTEIAQLFQQNNPLTPTR